MNEEHEMFLEEFGRGTRYKEVPPDVLEKYRGTLPATLLTFWREQGWCSYAKGLLWMVNPEDYAWLVDGWVSGFSEFPKANYYVFARSAFGEFYCLSDQSERVFTISAPRAALFVPSSFFKAGGSAELALDVFFTMSDPEDFDFFDDDDAPMFKRALKRLGPLAADECYGFVPALALGGSASVDHLSKLNMDVHIDILKQSATITLQII